MGVFDLFSDLWVGRNIKKKYVGNMTHLTFPTSKGEYTIIAKSANNPSGGKGITYDCFIIALNRWMMQGMSETDFIKDMKVVVNLVVEGNSAKETMEILLRKHIDKNGRLIDTDLCTYISELYMALVAIKGSCDRNYLLDQMLQVAEKNFGYNLYITQYRNSGFGLQPYLIPFNEFTKRFNH